MWDRAVDMKVGGCYGTAMELKLLHRGFRRAVCCRTHQGAPSMHQLAASLVSYPCSVPLGALGAGSIPHKQARHLPLVNPALHHWKRPGAALAPPPLPQALIGWSRAGRGTVVISFRGTASLENVKTDLRVSGARRGAANNLAQR